MTNPPISLLTQEDLDDLATLAAAAPPGDFVEVGVYLGGSAWVLYQIAQGQGRTLHLFDTWTGHPTVDATYDDLTIHPLGRFSDGALALGMLHDRMPHAQFHVGPFPDTWPPSLTVAFCHSDVDVYWPTEAVCRLIAPALVPGGQILFDDYPYEGCPGVKRAVQDAFGDQETVTIRASGKACYTRPR